jgi:hypothetical protein
MRSFEHFRLLMTGPFAPQLAVEIAEHLARATQQACATRGLTSAEIHCGGGIVTLFLTEREAWEAVVVGADAYQFYPGFLNATDGSITWPNIWVADDYTLDKFLTELEAALDEAARPLH